MLELNARTRKLFSAISIAAFDRRRLSYRQIKMLPYIRVTKQAESVMGIGGTGINILDRVGGGDAFASGLIYAMLHDYKAMDMINFAVASSAIKHTIHGDANITDEVSSIRNLMNMNYDIKR